MQFFRICTHILTRTEGKSLRICFSSKQQTKEPPQNKFPDKLTFCSYQESMGFKVNVR